MRPDTIPPKLFVNGQRQTELASRRSTRRLQAGGWRQELGVGSWSECGVGGGKNKILWVGPPNLMAKRFTGKYQTMDIPIDIRANKMYIQTWLSLSRYHNRKVLNKEIDKKIAFVRISARGPNLP
jgi:hypothetical protein